MLPALLRVLGHTADAEILSVGAACLGRFVARGGLHLDAAGLPTSVGLSPASGALLTPLELPPLWRHTLLRMLRPSLDENALEPAVHLVGEIVRSAPTLTLTFILSVRGTLPPCTPPSHVQIREFPAIALQHLLRPSRDLPRPSISLQMMLSPASYAAHAPQLLVVLVERLRSAKLLGLSQAILLTFSQAVLSPHLGPDSFVALVSALPTVGPSFHPSTNEPSGETAAEADEQALAFVLRRWVDTMGEVMHPAASKCLTLAMLSLVSPPFPNLCSLPVAAESAIDDAAPRTTRSALRRARRAASNAPPAHVPLLVRVFKIAAQTLAARRRHNARASANTGLADGLDDDEEEEGEDEEDEGEDEEDGDEDEAKEGSAMIGSRRGGARPSPFVSADALDAVSLAALLDGGGDGSGTDGDVFDDDDDDDDERDSSTLAEAMRSVDLAQCATEYMRKLGIALGEQQFGQLYATLTDNEHRDAVAAVLSTQ